MLVPVTLAVNDCDWLPATVAAVGEMATVIAIGSELEDGIPTGPDEPPPDVVVPPPVLVLVLVLPLLVALAVVLPPLVAAPLPGVALLPTAAANDSVAGVEKLRLVGALHEVKKPIHANKAKPRRVFSESCPRTPGLVVQRDDRIYRERLIR